MVALVALADGSLWRADVSSRGEGVLRPAQRDWEVEADAIAAAAASAPAASPGGALLLSPLRLAGRLALRALRGGAGPPPRGAACVSLCWAEAARDVAAPPAAGGPASLTALLLTAASLEAWSLPRAPGGRAADPLFARTLGAPLRNATPLALCRAAGADDDVAAVLLGRDADGTALQLFEAPVAAQQRGGLRFGPIILSAAAPPTRLEAPPGDGAGDATWQVAAGPGAAVAVSPAGGFAVTTREGDAAQPLLTWHQAAALGPALGAAPPAGAGGPWRLLTRCGGLLAWQPTEATTTATNEPAPPAPAPLYFAQPPAQTAAATEAVPPAAIAPFAALAASATEPDAAAAATHAAALLEAHRLSATSPGAASAALAALAAAGALAGPPERCGAALAARQLADARPKRWLEDASGATSAAHLGDKAQRLEALLTWLDAQGAWKVLSAASAADFLATGERLRAAQRVRRLFNDLADAAADTAAGGSAAGGAFLGRLAGDAEAASAAADALASALRAAGTALATQAAQPGAPPPVDAAALVFDAPSRSLETLFQALQAGLTQLGDAAATSSAMSAQTRWAAAAALAGAALGALRGEREWREAHAGKYPPAGGVGGLKWSAAPPARGALHAAATAAAALRRPLRSAGEAAHAAAAETVLYDASRALLDAAAAAAAAEPAGSPGRAASLAEHARVRDATLPALLDAALTSPSPGSGTPAVSVDAVEELAAAHRSYDTLYYACEASRPGEPPGGASAPVTHPATQRLARRMRQLRSGGGADVISAGPFAPAVFARLRDAGQLRRLLDALPPDLDDDVAAFLQDDPALAWMHAARRGHAAQAGLTLAAIGTSGAPARDTGDDVAGDHAAAPRPRAARLAALRLAKVALMAGGHPDTSAAVEAADGAAELLRLEEALLTAERLGADVAVGRQTGDDVALDPGAMAGRFVALGGEGPLFAVAVFAAAGPQFRQAHAALLGAAWRAAARDTDWGAASSMATAVSDAAYTAALGATLLARAAQRAFAAGQFVVGGRFGGSADDVAEALLADAGGADLLPEQPEARQAAAAALRQALHVGAAGHLPAAQQAGEDTDRSEASGQ